MKALLSLFVFGALTWDPGDISAAGSSWLVPMTHLRFLFEPAQKIPLSVFDVVFLLAAAYATVRPATWRERVRPLDLALLACAVGLLLAFLWGAGRGGDMRQSYYQAQAIVRTLVLAHVFLALFRTGRDLAWLAGAILAAALYRAVSCILYFFVYLEAGRIWPYPTAILTHADSALFAAAVAGLAAWTLSRPTTGRVLRALPLLLVLGMAIHYNNRRLAWLQVVGSLVLLFLLMPPGRARRRIARWVFLATPVLALYVAIGWQRPFGAFAPVGKIRSIVGESEDESSKSRDLENVGIILTLQANRLLGSGLGHPYHEVSTLYSAGMASYFQQYLYLPHNSLLGLASWTGVVLFPVVWCVHAVVGFLAARAARFARRPRDRTLAMAAFTVPFIYGVQSFGDMGILLVPVGVLLAIAIACASRLAVISGAWPARGRTERRLVGVSGELPRTEPPPAWSAP